MTQADKVTTKLVRLPTTQGGEVTHPVPDEVRFARVGHVLTVGYLVLELVVTLTHRPQRYRGCKIEPEREVKRLFSWNELRPPPPLQSVCPELEYMKIQTPKRFKRTLFIRIKHNMRIFGVSPFI